MIYKTIRKIYDGISISNRSAFWSITCNFVVAITTAWLGFTVSYFIVDSNEALQKKVLLYQNYQFFYKDVDAFLLEQVKLRVEFQKCLDTKENAQLLSKKYKDMTFLERKKVYILSEEVTNIRKTLKIDSLGYHLDLLTACLDSKSYKKIYENYQKIVLANLIMSNEIDTIDNAIVQNNFTSMQLKDPLAYRNGFVYLSKENIKQIRELREKIKEEPYVTTLYVAKDYIYVPLDNIEKIIRKNYVQKSESSKIYRCIIIPFALLIFIMMIGLTIWYILIVNLFKEKINPNSFDEYNILRTEKAVIEDRYQSKCSEILSYQNNKEILEKRLSDIEDQKDILESRYLWILNELRILATTDVLPNAQLEIKRILKDSAK